MGYYKPCHHPPSPKIKPSLSTTTKNIPTTEKIPTTTHQPPEINPPPCTTIKNKPTTINHTIKLPTTTPRNSTTMHHHPK